MKKIIMLLLLALPAMLFAGDTDAILSPGDLAQPENVTQAAETYAEKEREGAKLPAIMFTETGYMVKRWWEGGAAKMTAMGTFSFAVPDKTSIIDLYSFGYASAMLKREKKNDIDLALGYKTGFGGAALDLGGAYADDASVVYWITNDDVLVLKPSFVKDEGYTEYYDAKIEYARTIGAGFGAGVSIKKSSLIKSDIDSGEAYDEVADTNYDYEVSTKIRGEKTEWRASLDYTGRVADGNMFFNQGFAYSFALGAGSETEAPPLKLLKSMAWNELGRLSYLYGYDNTVSISDSADYNPIIDSYTANFDSTHTGTAFDLGMFISLDGKSRAELLVKGKAVVNSSYSLDYTREYSIFTSDNEAAEKIYKGYMLGVDFVERLYVGDFRDLILSARYSLLGYNYTAEKTPDPEEKGFFDRRSILSLGVTYDPGKWLLAFEGDIFDFIQCLKIGFETDVTQNVTIRAGGRVDFDMRYEYLDGLASYGMGAGAGVKWGGGFETDLSAGYFSDARYADSAKGTTYGDVTMLNGPEIRLNLKYIF